MNQTIILLLIGLAAGLMSGMLGIGGGIIIIPALITLLGYSQKEAQGTSLALLLPPIGLLAVINYYKAGYLNFRAAGIMIITFVIGSYITSRYVISLPENIIKKIFALFLLFYSIKLFMDR